MKTICILNQFLTCKEIGTYYAINFGLTVSNVGYKVLFISLSENYEWVKNLKLYRSKNKKLIFPFNLWESKQNFHLLFLADINRCKLNFNDVDLKNFFVKQLKLLKNDYDYLVVDLRKAENELTKYFYSVIKKLQKIIIINEKDYEFDEFSFFVNNIAKKYDENLLNCPIVVVRDKKSITKHSLQINNDFKTIFCCKNIFFIFLNNKFEYYLTSIKFNEIAIHISNVLKLFNNK